MLGTGEAGERGRVQRGLAVVGNGLDIQLGEVRLDPVVVDAAVLKIRFKPRLGFESHLSESKDFLLHDLR